ncbi:MAG TPA: glycine cleavage T C-terminal barrel domain-containing protein, partial [Solirubrobacteraceae bacterium]|nr:glycine cleavage T C-terminal barrel domain-containing protein [Solirubrobacteraceae bacterium]
LYGGEAVRRDGEVVGRVRSCAYAFTVGRNVALATVPPALGEDAPLSVEVLGSPVAAQLAPDVLYDPGNSRVLA